MLNINLPLRHVGSFSSGKPFAGDTITKRSRKTAAERGPKEERAGLAEFAERLPGQAS